MNGDGERLQPGKGSEEVEAGNGNSFHMTANGSTSATTNYHLNSSPSHQNQSSVPVTPANSAGGGRDGARDKNINATSWLMRPCLWVAVGIKWLPVLFISAVIAWSYYAFVVVVCWSTVNNMAEKVSFLIFYHIILVLFVWSYFQTIFAPICEAPSSWNLSPAMVDRLNKATSEEDWKNLLELFVVEMELSVMQRSVQGAIRYCDKCEAIKPDRSHHCSVCGKCILKMDHHCPWVNNCVAFNNYKFFMLFLGYALIYCVYLAGCVFKYFILFWTDGLQSEGSGKFHILFLFFVSVMFCISVSSLFWYHVYLVLHNRSTLEQFRAPYFANGQPDEDGWSLGKRNNFQEVFGDRWQLWFLPVKTAIGDGLTYPTRISSAHVEATYQSTSSRVPMVPASPAANAVRGRSHDICYIDDEATGGGGGNAGRGSNGLRHTEVILDVDERVQVKVSGNANKKSDLMQLQ